MRKSLILLTVVAVLGLTNYGIFRKEVLIREGALVLLELAPVDPRSLMQGDYMALRYALEEAVRGQDLRDGYLVLELDTAGVASLRGIVASRNEAHDGMLMRFRIRNNRPQLASNAFFFEEGTASMYGGARYGEFRVGRNGEALLTGLRGEDLQKLGTAERVLFLRLPEAVE